ncbi:hypothetical protein AB0O07_01375 [Streptomyces sp. NPDC093085]|uniref:hypothetical protein n=1 Tax=Streptomyces sp. NPDC093085 TaxID=3155068 RepID=UPI00343F4069
MTDLGKTVSAVILVSCLLTTGCATDGTPAAGRTPAPAGSGTGEPVPHGYVEGAEETAEQQSRLVLADAAGTVRVLDLTTEDLTTLPGTGAVRGLTTDGRFAYVATDTGAQIVDAGAWMVDHGDHVHYYRAEIRPAGAVSGPGPVVSVHTDPVVTAVSFTENPARPVTSARLFDRTALERGRPGTGRALPGSTAAEAVPYQEHLVVPGTGADHDRVEIRDRAGARVATPDETCAEPSGTALTRRGVVIGCADGALLVYADGGSGFTAQKIPYGSAGSAGSAGADVPKAERATAFRHRAGSTTLTAPAGPDAAWVLDVTERRWHRIETGPVAALNTAGESTPLLALGTDGRLSAYDIATGKRTATTRLLTPPATGPAPVIEVDTSRAYVNDPAARKVHEIDYNDHLRRARTFSLPLTPAHMVETGR